ncbi:hypothetical protein [Shigella flexneri]|uniref:hypothetical protein n=1 Tax=Shigella flexneri TaxID=623 RepID=UPI003F5414B1
MAEQIPNGSTLFIDIGTTPEAVAHALLNHSNLRIVTRAGRAKPDPAPSWRRGAAFQFG